MQQLDGFVGKLSKTSSIEVLYILLSSSKSLRVQFMGESKSGSFFIDGGEPIHAFLIDELTGEKKIGQHAALEIMGMKNGIFRINVVNFQLPRTINKNFKQALITAFDLTFGYGIDKDALPQKNAQHKM